MHSLIEIGQVVLDKKRFFFLILNTILSNQYYLPIVKIIALHLKKFKKSKPIWTRQIKESYYCCSRTPKQFQGEGGITLLEHSCFSHLLSPPPPSSPLKIPRSTSESYL